VSWVAGAALGFFILTAAVRDFLAGPLSSVLESALFTTAALYGAIIYKFQLAAVQRSRPGDRAAARSWPFRGASPSWTACELTRFGGAA
jgi:hypothetical protein